MRDQLRALSLYCGGDYFKIKKCLERGFVPSGNFKKEPSICYGDELYPSSFYKLKHPPYVIYYRGNPKLLNSRCISIVGSRKPSLYALEMTEKITDNLKENYTIVSGLAKGIDACAHKASLDFHTIGVLGCGVDIIYPTENKYLYDMMSIQQCIISEYPAAVKPNRHHFPFRNRLIAALGEELIVMSATLRSGTMTTVNEALLLNKNVKCLPHPIGEPTGVGCNQLIKEGADILTNIEDI